MKIRVVLSVLFVAIALPACTTIDPATGAYSRGPGTYQVRVLPGCGVEIDSSTIKGGPTLLLTQTPDGDCTVEVRHNPSVAELQPILNILGAF